MRIDVVTIFPEYLAPLGLSLPGRAQENGLVDVPGGRIVIDDRPGLLAEF